MKEIVQVLVGYLDRVLSLHSVLYGNRVAHERKGPLSVFGPRL